MNQSYPLSDIGKFHRLIIIQTVGLLCRKMTHVSALWSELLIITTLG